MFSYITKKLNHSVCLIVGTILILYFLSIFFVYSLFLKNDFTEKSQNIGQKISNHLIMQCESIEDVVENCVYTASPTQLNYSEIVRLLKSCLSSNINISNAFFFNDTEYYYYSHFNTNTWNEYISLARSQYEQLSDTQWDIFTPTNSQTAILFYRYKVTWHEKTLGYLVIEPDIDAYLKNADIYNNNFIQNTAIFIGDYNKNCMNLYVPENNIYHLSFISASFHTKEVKTLLKVTINYPLNDYLYMQLQFSIQNVLNSTKLMFFVFCLLFLLIVVICWFGIHHYTQYIDHNLTNLAKQLDTMTKTEKESRKEKNHL